MRHAEVKLDLQPIVLQALIMPIIQTTWTRCGAAMWINAQSLDHLILFNPFFMHKLLFRATEEVK